MKPTIMIIADRRGQRQVAMERGMELAAKLGYQVTAAGFVYENLEGQGISGKTRQERARKKLLTQRRSEIQALIRRFKPAPTAAPSAGTSRPIARSTQSRSGRRYDAAHERETRSPAVPATPPNGATSLPETTIPPRPPGRSRS